MQTILIYHSVWVFFKFKERLHGLISLLKIGLHSLHHELLLSCFFFGFFVTRQWIFWMLYVLILTNKNWDCHIIKVNIINFKRFEYASNGPIVHIGYSRSLFMIINNDLVFILKVWKLCLLNSNMFNLRHNPLIEIWLASIQISNNVIINAWSCTLLP